VLDSPEQCETPGQTETSQFEASDEARRPKLFFRCPTPAVLLICTAMNPTSNNARVLAPTMPAR